MRRRWRISVGIGLVVGVVVGLGVVAAMALPLFALAEATEPDAGLDRPFVRTGLTRVVLPVAAGSGVVAAVLGGRAARRGWKLPAPQ